MNLPTPRPGATGRAPLNFIPLSFLLFAAQLVAAESGSLRVVDVSTQLLLGWDTNPIASAGASALVLGAEESFVTVAGAKVNLAAGKDAFTFKLSYAAEHTRFERLAEENFTTHRIATSARHTAGAWTTTLEASTLLVDGDREGLLSTAAANANAVALWRDRRAQWQHRAKLQTQITAPTHLVRATATGLDYDYRTRVNSTCVPFTDRSDAQLGTDFGWKYSPRSTWLAGARVGQQRQATVALPNSAFDYGNRYQRLGLGWEGTLSSTTTATFTAGPDFRHYTGAVDPRVCGERDRVSLWFEGNLTAKPRPGLVFTARTARFEWLSSTGKSAYRDSSIEVAAAWTIEPTWTIRSAAKLHQCDYYPVVRDDWESLLILGITHKISPRFTVTGDVTHHRGWNALPHATEREFTRLLATFGLTWTH